ncbi:N-acetyl-beta-glucosaminyl-glycoprotein 4-beta-N-acetylgalactosaminyltransferase 1-like [Conger conger]|uniref:N-acetyl-beta-glucosaminyl-glycoprotein 4-beta-N-acetylgalactosaminyltransferase 1-like n=1 Tax=Conger conger TaxID=82655 RepID=UPI002A5A57D8|nr:N-acetyl-beta-glucosaminyl-glycoprotein 4-beta-N-acetylgalactosaminyltransferase 1-like [Conger conger]
MLRFPVKKIRKQFKLLLLLVLLTFAIWFTYLHINQGKAIKLHFNYGKDGEKQSEGTETSRRRQSRSSSNHHRNDDVSDSREDDPAEDGPYAWEEGRRDLSEIRKFLGQKQNKLPWKPEYKGQANLHVFEDWCGSSVSQLRKNIHFPLYPHSRTTVKKLAVAPKWKNYGLRIFGFIHPYRDGDFQFAVASDDNSEFWLSPDDSPLNARLLVYVGRRGSEWTAPGEFSKFRSQSSKSIHLISSRRYYFEILHKQDDKGSDHVEVGWRPFLPGLKYEVIDSAYISLYTDESSLKMNSVDHIPQTLASHSLSPQQTQGASQHGADMLKLDPRDTFYSRAPMIEPSHLESVLPSCLYAPTYVVKDFPIARYQGLQFVYLSFVYPNDFTRLTHMERENKCFYRESPIYLEKFGFYKYMKMDEEEDEQPVFFPNPDDFLEEEEGEDPEDEAIPVDSQRARRNGSRPSPAPRPSHRPALLTPVTREAEEEEEEEGDVLAFKSRERREGSTRDPTERRGVLGEQQQEAETPGSRVPSAPFTRSLSWVRTAQPSSRGGVETPPKLSKSALLFPHKSSLSALTSRARQVLSSPAIKARGPAKPRPNKESKVYITRPRPSGGRRGTTPHLPREVFPGVFLYQNGKSTRLVNLGTRRRGGRGLGAARQLWPKPPLRLSRTSPRGAGPGQGAERARLPHSRREEPLRGRRESRRGAVTSTPNRRDSPSSSPPAPPTGLTSPTDTRVTSYIRTSEVSTSLGQEEARGAGPEEEEGGVSDYSYEEAEPRPGWAEDSINWQRTFSVNSMDFELLRSDWNDLRCNVSGNLQLAEGEVVELLAQYMEKLNERNGGIYTLLRIINVEKRRDSVRGSRYLVELELMERGKRVVHLSEYVYLLLQQGRAEDSLEDSAASPAPSSSPGPPAPAAPRPSSPGSPTPGGTAYVKPLLCQPSSLRWSRDVMVHFVVPVKNQARWVQQFIADMELLHLETKDDNFSIIIVDFESEDMDVEQALRDSQVPRYEYLRREGHFERSAGLQMGVDTIEDSRSIVFLCDLHIHFPFNILESIRKHCVEGRLAFAPIVMRLSCGSSPKEPDGYWEVNGFGLFGIYKSDFDTVGGMNTEEFKDRWGGEDWELLDRVLQHGLEVERLRLRNFFHYYHSKRGMWNAPMKRSPRG